MQKVGDTGDISAMFLACANFWAILGHFWAILAILSHFWAIMGNFGSFWLIFRSFFGANFFGQKFISTIFITFCISGYRLNFTQGSEPDLCESHSSCTESCPGGKSRGKLFPPQQPLSPQSAPPHGHFIRFIHQTNQDVPLIWIHDYHLMEVCS